MTRKGKIGLGVAVVAFLGWNVYGYSRLRETSRRLVESFERSGHITARSCRPSGNTARMTGANWKALAGRGQDTMLRSLALVCMDEGTAFSMTVFDADTSVKLAHFDGD